MIFEKKGGAPIRAKIIAVDFDGTLIEEGKWPGIGATNEKVLNYCKTEQAKGARIILWTNRVGEPLETAVNWCEEHGLRLDAVNDNVPESVEFFGTNTRKIYADEFIDDRMAKGFNLPYLGEPELVPRQQVLCDMNNPDGGYAAMAAKDYYYEHYATDKERKAMDRWDNLVTAFGIIFAIAFWAAVIFAVAQACG